MAAAYLRVMFALVLALSLSGCLEGKDGKDGANGTDGKDASPVLLKTSAEPAGANCPVGGYRIDSGLDVNFNGVLDTAEIQIASYICHGADGADGLFALASTTPIDAGAECPAGGYRIDTGIDLNGNDSLDVVEIQQTSYVCNGVDGQDGADGLVALIKTEIEAPGVTCPAGGLRVLSGVDANRNGLLDAGEETQTSYLCNGEAGADGQDGANALLASTQIPAGAQCVTGGYRLDTGLDTSGNSLLEEAEITSSFYVCNGVDGQDGADALQSLINVSTELAGANCLEGGKLIQIGADINRNSILELDEVQQSAYLCNGESGLDGADGLPGSDGANALMSSVEEPAGANCAAGGVAISTGLDQNADNVLDAAEVQSTVYICHGTGGPDAQSFILQYTAQPGGAIVGSTVQEVMLGGSGEAVTAVPDSGYYFTVWSDGSTAASRTDASVQADLNVQAGFAIYQYTLTYTAGSNGSLSGAAGQTVFHGSDGSAVEAVPNTGYHFTSWSDDSTQNPRIDPAVQQNISVSAAFSVNEYSLTYQAGSGGSITGNSVQLVAHGNDAEVVAAVADTGYRFLQWSDGVTSSNRTDVNVTGDFQVTAEFTVDQYSLTYESGHGGYVQGSASQHVLHGGNGTEVTAIPSAGYSFGSWSDGVMTASRMDSGITSSIQVTANFLYDTPVPWQASAVSGDLLVQVKGPSKIIADWVIESGSSYSMLVASDPATDVNNYAAYGGEMLLDVVPPLEIQDLPPAQPVYITLFKDGEVFSWSSASLTTLHPNKPVRSMDIDNALGRYVVGEFDRLEQYTGYGITLPVVTADLHDPHLLSFPTVEGFSGTPSSDAGVYAAVPDGNGGWYVGGSFSRVAGQTRRGVFHVGPDGVLTDWISNINGTVYAMLLVGDTLYVGGKLSSVNGMARQNVAAITRDGQVVDWLPAVDNAVHDLVHHNGTLYIGGEFLSVDGIERNRLAAFDAAGALTAWAPGANFPVYTLDASQGVIYVGGSFSAVGGGYGSMARNHLAAISETGSVMSWRPDANAAVRKISINDEMVYAGGDFTAIDGNARQYVAAISTAGLLDSWSPMLDGAVHEIFVYGARIYIGGTFTSVTTQQGVFGKSNLVVVDQAGNVVDWQAHVSGSVYAVSATGSSIFVGGTFEYAAGEERNGAAALDTAGNLTSWAPSVNGTVNSIAVGHGRVYLGGVFSDVDGAARQNLAAVSFQGDLESWAPAGHENVSQVRIWGEDIYVAGELRSGGAIDPNKGLCRFEQSGLVLGCALSPGYVNDVHVSEYGVRVAYAKSGEQIQDLDHSLVVRTTNSVIGGIHAIIGSSTSIVAGGQYYWSNPNVIENLGYIILSGGTSASWNPAPNNAVTLLASGDGYLFVAGSFSNISGQSRKRIAAFSGTTLLDWHGVDDYINTMVYRSGILFTGGYTLSGRGALRAIDVAGNLLPR